jgi:hypothetical protein
MAARHAAARRSPAFVGWCGLALSTLLGACGPAPEPDTPGHGGQAAPPSPGAAPNEAPHAAQPGSGRGDPSLEPHIRDALAELEAAERTLLEHTGRAAGDAPAPEGPPKPSKPKPRAPPADEKRPDASPPRAPTGRATTTSCDAACQALASMQRAAAYLCRLAGQQDPRCERAAARVRTASDRVATSCGSCGPAHPLSDRSPRDRRRPAEVAGYHRAACPAARPCVLPAW